MSKPSISIFWLRRDLRLEDNAALYYALREKEPVLPIFIFDSNIIDKLSDKDDARVSFIHQTLSDIKAELESKGSTLVVKYNTPEAAYQEIFESYDVKAIYTNRDYEPYAKERDTQIERLAHQKDITFLTFKDQVIFEKDEILTDGGDFYKVFTPYKNKWLAKYKESNIQPYPSEKHLSNLYKTAPINMPSLKDMGFEKSTIEIPSSEAKQDIIANYDKTRDFPAVKGTTRLGIHLRFGTISIRQLVQKSAKLNDTYLSELIWREFYSMVLYHNPQVVDHAFKPQYDRIPWRTSEEDFERWCQGKTGYPIVDAGMRELNATGYMHNRVRMIVASFLTKHLLLDWRWGEAYFARKLLDFELASNNGGWQWAAGTGTDAQPYFRVFNPSSQTEKFDKDLKYIKKWVPEYGTQDYVKPMVEHKFARERAISTFKEALNQ